MKSPASRLFALVVVVLALTLAPRNSLAQTVTASPVALSFGVPTGTTAVPPCTVPCSAAESLVVNIVDPTGAPVTFGTATVTGTNAGDFVVSGDSCSGQTFTAAATCQVAIYFSSSLAPATTLETATLTLPIAPTSSATAPPPVPLSGAYGAIKLWNETNVTTSLSTASFTNMYTIASAGLNLSCPTSPTVAPIATLSNTPDGNGYVLVDNYITVSVNGSLLNNGLPGNNPQGNVCSGGPSDSSGGVSFNDCFSSAYQGPAGSSYGLNGQDPDTFTNPGNPVLNGAAGGLPPINLSSFFPSGPVQATFDALDSGYVYTSSTVFLATNCTPGGIVPGGTATGNPTPTNTVTFDSNPGADLSITDNTAQNPPATGTVPMYTQIAVPQQLFYQLVEGTSAAPDVCLRAASEQDPSNNNAPMCVGILIQCYDPATQTTSGNNCDSSTPVGLRDLFDTVQFASPDAPVNGTNFLTNSSTNACSYYLSNPNNLTGGSVSGGSCATGTGPTVLMGGDNWLCASGDFPPTPCTSLEPNSSTAPVFNTSTPYTETVYSEANGALLGGLTGDLSPLGTLTQFLGAADGSGGSSVPIKNSVLFLVANHPLPTESATIAGRNGNGWINTATINATFNSSAATYAPGTTNPPSNSFVPAPPYSLTYGISTWPALPDTTYPVPGDATNYNATVNPNLGASGTGWVPLCPAGPIPATPGSFTSNSTGNSLFTGLSNGIYNVHYFTTDCALTEGLVFNPTGSQLSNATANWASFPFVTVGVDTSAPTLACSTSPSPVYNAWYNTNVTVSCSATDPAPGSGFAPGTAVANAGNTVLQGSLTTSFNTSTAVLPASTNPAASIVCASCTPSTPAGDLQISDLAGNPSNTQGPYSFQIDLQAPVILGPALSPTASGNKYVVGSATTVTITYSCNDGVGSGVASCTEVGALPSGTTTNCTSTAELVSCTSSFTPAPTNVGSYSIYVNAADNVGNPSSTSSTPVTFSVADAPATVLFGALPASAVTPGKELTYYVGAVDTDPAKTPVPIYGATINVTLKIPSGTLASGTATAISDDVACTSWPCTVMPTTGPACTVTPSSVTGATTAVSVSCSVGTIPDIFTSKSAVIVKIVLPTAAKAPAGTVSTSGTITATTPISGITSFSSSVSIK
jgi:hypothetical protein